MRIYDGLNSFSAIENAVVTSGTFDGVHKGHQQILKRLRSICNSILGQTVLITFWPHPRLVLDPEYNLKLITTFEEKAKLLEAFGVDHLIKIHFTREFSQLSSHDFIQQVLVDKIGTRKLVIGYDHKFGRNREGTFQYLKDHSKQFGFDVEEIPRHEIDETVISSTKIRQALATGDIESGNQYLGKPYSIVGKVVHGDKRGQEIGYPTANISISSTHKLIPCDGVYAVKALVRGKLIDGMLNIGFRPTVSGNQRSIEVNLFDFDQKIYGEELRISFYKSIRKEIKFDNLDSLKKQLGKDKLQILKFLKTIPYEQVPDKF